MTKKGSTEKTVWSNIGYWLTEIVIVFVGVYLAFLLNGYRTEQRNERKKQQIYTALYHYFSAITPNIKRNTTHFDSTYVNPFLKAYRNKEMPRLKKWPFIKIGINDHTWNAMLQSGGIDLLDIEFIWQVSSF